MFIMFTARPRHVPRSIASHVLAVLGALVLLVVGLSLAIAYAQAVRLVEDATASRVTDVALAVAATDDVREGLTASDPAAALARIAERERQATGTDFIVIMSPDGIRYTHPNPDLVGGQFAGAIAEAQAGGIVLEQYAGSLGPSTRAVVPVIVDGELLGLVAVGLQRERVTQQLTALLPQILLPGLAVALLGGLGAWVVAERVRRQTLGLNAAELRRLHEHHNAVLHAVREGLVITGADGRIEVINDEAQRLLGLGPDAVDRRVDDLGLSPGLAATLVSHELRVDVAQASGGRALVVSSDTVQRQGQQPATLTTLRDRTELADLTGQLTATRSLADALHAQAHEAANRLHTVTTLIELGRPDEAVRFATDEVRTLQRQSEQVLAAIEEPAIAGLLLGKAAQAAERGVQLDLDPDAHLPAGLLPAGDVVSILGNLIDNAVDSVAGLDADDERLVEVDAQVRPGSVVLTVSDTGPGLTPEQRERAFTWGFSTKAADSPAGRGIGLTLVRQTVDLLGGSIEVSDPPGATFTVRLPVLQPDSEDRP